MRLARFLVIPLLALVGLALPLAAQDVKILPAPPVLVAPVQVAQPLPPGPGPAPALNNDDEKILRDLRLPVDATALLDYFRSRTHPEADPKKMAGLINALGSHSFRTRETAYVALMQQGHSALLALKEAETVSDAETQRRAVDLKRRIEEKANPVVQMATARLLAKAKPQGTVEVLLNYLPFAADVGVIDEIAHTLTAINQENGQPHPALLKALGDKLALKRGVAAEALGPLVPARAQVTAMLKDSDAHVRLRAALVLATARVKEAVPVLINTMTDLPPEDLWPAEELLVRLAGEKSPAVSLGSDEPSRKACCKAWTDWYETEGVKVSMDKLGEEPQLLGYTVIVQQTLNRIVGGRVQRSSGEVIELDKNKKERFKINVENTYPVDAQVVGNDRVLITEYNGRRVTERDSKGAIVWEYNCALNPISSHRLPNGNTFVVTQSQLLEIDRNKTQTFTYQRNNSDIMRARKLRSGEIALITNTGQYVRLDAKTQKETANFHVGQLGNIFGNFEVLPNGNVLVPVYQQQAVVEYNPQGKEVWRANTPWPSSAQRLPNGNTLVASINTRRVIEINRQGQEVWTHNVDGQVFNARRR